ncbi:extracellular matrix protein [Pimephales promelas]|nr:extracellular matrix protein [Pimephales promelas]
MFWKSTLVVTTLILHLISLGVGQKLYPEVLLESNFPPARPSYYNLKAICYYGNGRPRFPDSIFPSSGYAYARRAGNAVNRLETWFSWCCYRGSAYVNEQTLCCAKQAWKTALSQFCIEEYSTMTLVHECCEKKKEERQDEQDRGRTTSRTTLRNNVTSANWEEAREERRRFLKNEEIKLSVIFQGCECCINHK